MTRVSLLGVCDQPEWVVIPLPVVDAAKQRLLQSCQNILSIARSEAGRLSCIIW